MTTESRTFKVTLQFIHGENDYYTVHPGEFPSDLPHDTLSILDYVKVMYEEEMGDIWDVVEIVDVEEVEDEEND